MNDPFRADYSIFAFRRGGALASLAFITLFFGPGLMAESRVDCSYPGYSRIIETQTLHGRAMLAINTSDELVLALNEGGFADIENGTAAVDKIFQIALKYPDTAQKVMSHWGAKRVHEVQIVKRSASGFSELEVRLLDSPFYTWAFDLDSYGCSEYIDGLADVPIDRRHKASGLSTVRLSGKRLSMDQALREYMSRPLVSDQSISGPALQWTYCGHGGPGTLSCSVSLPFGLGCSASCLPGHYACCNSFGGCGCEPMNDDDGGVGDPSPGEGGGDGDGGGNDGDGDGGSDGGGWSPPNPPQDDDDEDDDEEQEEGYFVGGQKDG